MESFEGRVSGSLGGTDTSLTVATGLVREGELPQVPADHVELDLDIVKGLAVVDSHEVADHLGHDDAVSKVGFDGGGLLTGEGVLLGLLAFHVEPVVSMLDF